jgi:hypothetical protein
MKVEAFSNFYLVGGTSLSLQMGHRNSIDIDLLEDKKSTPIYSSIY